MEDYLSTFFFFHFYNDFHVTYNLLNRRSVVL